MADVTALSQGYSPDSIEELAEQILEQAKDFHIGDGTGVVEYVEISQKLAYLGCRLARKVLGEEGEDA